MKDHDVELKLQALLDGELSGAETAAVRQALGCDPEAQALHAELQTVKALLKGNEPEFTIRESREFYWSGIARAIEREERQAVRRESVPLLRSWMRLLVPAGALAALALTLTMGWQFPGHGKHRFPALVGSHEIETTLEGAPTFTFRSDPEAMTVVWVDSGPN